MSTLVMSLAIAFFPVVMPSRGAATGSMQPRQPSVKPTLCKC